VDLIDTPAVGTGRGYRDGYVLNEVSTVINSYAVGALRALERLYATSSTNKARRKSAQLGHQANATSDAINKRCVNHSSGLYSDGAFGKAQHHSAWHANVWPISFNLQSPLRWPSTLAFLRRKRMAGSVYGAYWLLRALYNMDVDHGDLALELLTSCDTNSWCSMLRAGATTVMEAWSREGKPNLSWSHPWASAPASAITWGFFGIRPTSAGFKTFIFQPQPGNVTRAK
jgi:alpha-L-rhamnosidase